MGNGKNIFIYILVCVIALIFSNDVNAQPKIESGVLDLIQADFIETQSYQPKSPTTSTKYSRFLFGI